MAGFPAFWLRRGAFSNALLPLAALYGWLAERRRKRLLAAPPAALERPVIVVGNIFVGGTGKTPLVVWLAEYLLAQDRKPGIITRGYGGRSDHWPRAVTAHTSADEVGDEPVLLARRTGIPVVASPDRVAAARQLLRDSDCDIIISDDGLQHYRLPRNLELVVLDAQRGLGNGRLLPAGPLREPAERLASVDMVIANGGPTGDTPYAFTLALEHAVNLATGERRALSPANFPAGVHAVAGIGNPERFFQSLRAFDLALEAHPYPDHHRYTPADLAFPDQRPVLMTEKDAVKCGAFADARHWMVPARAVFEDAARDRLAELLRRFCVEEET